MSGKRVFAITRRVVRQVLRDRRTVALLFLAPMMILTLGAILFRADTAPVPVGVVSEDVGLTVPGRGTVNLGERIQEELAASDTLETVSLSRDEVDARLRDGTVQAAVILSQDLTATFVSTQHAALDLRLEGSNPTRSMSITLQVTQAATRALASLAETGLAGGTGASGVSLQPLTVETTYLYGGPEFDALDSVAPVYVGFLAMFFSFLLACVAFLRERSQGTIERLAATPATRSEIVLGYLTGLGLFGLVQVSVILFYTVWVLDVHHVGGLGLPLLVIALLGLVGVSLGILASAFARTEFQVIQFIPLAILPQVLLGDTFWSVADLPSYLKPFAYAMPLYYANTSMRDVMIKGWGLPEIWPRLAVLVGFTVLCILLSTAMMRREVA